MLLLSFLSYPVFGIIVCFPFSAGWEQQCRKQKLVNEVLAAFMLPSGSSVM